MVSVESSLHKLMGNGCCCSEKFRKFVRRESHSQNFWYPAHNRKIVLMQTSGLDTKWMLWRCAFWRSQPTRYQNPKIGTPNPKNRVLETDLIYPVRRINIGWIHRWNYFWNPNKNGGDITTKLHAWAAPGQTLSAACPSWTDARRQC